MLALAVRMFDEHPRTIEQVRSRLQAFTVDEYQDVNPLQAALLDRWVGERDEVCVVGDDYQTIYSFTGASPEHLLRFTDRFPGARVVRLEDSYRSTPEILATANRLAETMGGFRKMLKAMRPGGPSPVLQPLPDEAAEVSFVVEEIRRLRDGEGVALEEIAVLYRINARSEPYEEALSAAGIPYQVRDGAFLRRPGPRAVMQGLRRENGSPSDAVDRVTDALGFDPQTEPDAAEEVTRQADLSRLRTLAAEFASSQPGAEVGAFVEEVTRRFSATETARGVNLMTFHRAKGLEFDAVFLPRLVDGELPFRSGRTKANEDEERRLLYVGITRARTHLFMTWPLGAKWARSPFLAELGAPSHREAAGVRARELQAARTAQRRGKPPAVASPLYDRLRQWRKARAQADGVPAYVVFPDTTLTALVAARPLSRKELLAVSGVGPAKMDLYGGELLELISDAINDGL
jgi:DNA helicase-2/ATP-dependent DNA helicase PcrA